MFGFIKHSQMVRSSILVVFVFVQFSDATKRDDVMTMATTELGITFWNQAELTVIAKCCEPQFYSTPNNNTAILSAAKNCILKNSGNKAVPALAPYSNVNNCLNPETLDSVVSDLIAPVLALADALVRKVKTTLSDCKDTNTQTGAAKQEACIQKTYGVILTDLTLAYVDGICKKIVNENVEPKEWGCGLKYIPSVLTFSKYACSKIVKN
ncbi:hypothetical protein B9Z55_018777 [Caenorhabditis nigoni]|uniref:DUF19 domain-containing protein n=1 Tax=Caenorhabditis nigoni TaxID=1611254 RepID=A0A2G5TFQ3_9PELO|nr:hypothetical protein B9Z55_018777 [Caenorhabditis nigoni]